MGIDPNDIDVESMTAEEFIDLVRSSDDDDVRTTFRAVGSAASLDRIFGMMPDYYVPARAGDVDAHVQWKINDGTDDHYYVIHFTPDACESWGGTVEDPTTTVSTDIVRFARIVSGQANPIKLLMTRKLKASGDVMFARRINSFFDIPG